MDACAEEVCYLMGLGSLYGGAVEEVEGMVIAIQLEDVVSGFV